MQVTEKYKKDSTCARILLWTYFVVWCKCALLLWISTYSTCMMSFSWFNWFWIIGTQLFCKTLTINASLNSKFELKLLHSAHSKFWVQQFCVLQIANWIVKITEAEQVDRCPDELKVIAEYCVTVLAGPPEQRRWAAAVALNLTVLQVCRSFVFAQTWRLMISAIHMTRNINILHVEWLCPARENEIASRGSFCKAASLYLKTTFVFLLSSCSTKTKLWVWPRSWSMYWPLRIRPMRRQHVNVSEIGRNFEVFILAGGRISEGSFSFKQNLGFLIVNVWKWQINQSNICEYLMASKNLPFMYLLAIKNICTWKLQERKNPFSPYSFLSGFHRKVNFRNWSWRLGS